MGRMADEIREESQWTMLFADDIVIYSKSKEQVEEKLESWRYALKQELGTSRREAGELEICIKTRARNK